MQVNIDEHKITLYEIISCLYEIDILYLDFWQEKWSIEEVILNI